MADSPNYFRLGDDATLASMRQWAATYLLLFWLMLLGGYAYAQSGPTQDTALKKKACDSLTKLEAEVCLRNITLSTLRRRHAASSVLRCAVLALAVKRTHETHLHRVLVCRAFNRGSTASFPWPSNWLTLRALIL